jgi:hypothetical protein
VLLLRRPQSSLTPTSQTQLDLSGRFTQAYPAYPSPLPLLSLAPAQVASLRGNLSRRRSSYPPTTPLTTTWSTGTPNAKSSKVFDPLPSFGTELSSDMATGWEGLLDFGTTPEPQKDEKILDPKATIAQVMARAKSEPGEAKMSKIHMHMNPGRIAQVATDLAWKTILGSVIEIESVGEVGVCRVLQEVWKRGGGETVSCGQYSAHPRSLRKVCGRASSWRYPSHPRRPGRFASLRLPPKLPRHCSSCTI